MDETTSNVKNLNTGSRKKLRNNNNNRRRPRDDKYKDQDPLRLDFSVNCHHNKPSSKFKCSKIHERDIIRNRKLLYNKEGKIHQDIYLCRLITSFRPKQKSSKTTAKPKPRKFSTNFFLLNDKKKAVRVCRLFFMKVFDLGRRRLNTICKTISDGKIPRENRGGDRKSKKSVAKMKSVCNFIDMLPARESHYARNKSCRIYLSCDLNITKLWKLYNDSVAEPLKVKKWFFSHIFHTQYNIGFSSPASDACTTCVLMSNKIKAEKNQHQKQIYITEKRIHKLRANAFYQFMREKEEDVYSFCFDLQQVMPLPKTPIQDSFYARQISFYNFCVVGMEGRNPNFYCWTEDMAGRGSTEVGSALLNYLNDLQKTGTLEGFKSLHLFCDGCGGQNKNSYIIDTLMFWLTKHSPALLKEILIIYPVRGHSFLPADRVFGRIEKDLRKVPVITTTQHYREIISRHGKVNYLGENWKYYNIKDLETFYKKVDGIRDLKRIYLQKKIVKNKVECTIKTFQNYRFQTQLEEKHKNLLKRGIKSADLKITEKELGHFIKGPKKKDVENLLVKQFGENWKKDPQLKWYCEVLYERDESNDDDDENVCDCLEPDCAQIHV